MESNYYLLFKTAQAEQRAWNNLADDRRKLISPIVELTRGRKMPKRGVKPSGEPMSNAELMKTASIYSFEKTASKALESFASCHEVILDLTREPSLSCFEIDQLCNSNNGYKNWVDFAKSWKDSHPQLIPTIIINPSSVEQNDEAAYLKSLEDQITALYSHFDKIAYRVSILADPDFLYDFTILNKKISSFLSDGKEFYVLLDHEYIYSNSGPIHAKRSSNAIDLIKQEISPSKIICISTSYPKNVTDLGDENNGSFSVEEIYLYDKLKADHPDIFYGDYGSINPVRNDAIVMARGWRPKIEFISSNPKYRTHYIREKRVSIGKDSNGKNILAPYSRHYISVAKKVVSNAQYQALSNSWGSDCIKKTSTGDVSGTSPSFWISVRMEMHIIQILRMLKLEP